MLMRQSVRNGQNRRVLNLWLIWLPVFIGGGRSRYTCLTINVIVMYLCELPPTLAEAWLRNLSVNMSGWQGGFKPDDLMQEHFNQLIKALIRAGMSLRSKNFQNLVVSSLYMDERGTKLEEGMGICQTSEKRRRQQSNQVDSDVGVLLRDLNSQDVFLKRDGGRLLNSRAEFSSLYPDLPTRGSEKFQSTINPILAEGVEDVEAPNRREDEESPNEQYGEVEDGEDNFDEILNELERE
ncbi:hypothetical protein HDU93_004409 [Gonapodya sp. JEL0774]|nr:hypothetical protein HDU93_004409 [Gonapodya sp. JEL0774]